MPEVYGEQIHELPSGVRQVIFNQNTYMTFAGIGTNPTLVAGSYLENPDLIGVLVVSEDNADYVRYGFPQVRVERIHQGINTTIFYPPARNPLKQIAYMPRRYNADIMQVIQLLKARGNLRDWSLHPDR